MAESESPSTRERLSREAARLFATRGYHGTSIRDLADALGIHREPVYAHVTQKGQLLEEICAAGATSFHNMLAELPSHASGVERLRNAFKGHLIVVKTQLDVATVWLTEWRHLEGESRESFLAGRRRYRREIEALFEAAIAEGALRNEIDVRAATLVFLSVGNWAYTWMTDDTSASEAADALWALLFVGLASGTATAEVASGA